MATYATLRARIALMLQGLIAAASAADWEPPHPDKDFDFREKPETLTATSASLRVCWLQQGSATIGGLATGSGGSHKIQALQLVACYPAALRDLDLTIGLDSALLQRRLTDSAQHAEDPEILLLQYLGYTVQPAVNGLVQVSHSLRAQYIEHTL